MRSKYQSPNTLVYHPYGIFQWCVTEVQPRTWLWTKPKANRAWVCSFLRDPILPYVYQRYHNCLCSTQSAMDFAAAVNSTHSSRAQDNWSAPSAAGPLLSTVILVSVTYRRRAWTCSLWKIDGRVPVGRSGGSPNPFSTETLSGCSPSDHTGPIPVLPLNCWEDLPTPIQHLDCWEGANTGKALPWSHRICNLVLQSPLEHKSPLREREGKAEKSEMGWRNRWCQLTWTREAEFELCIQFKTPNCINSQACLWEKC